MSYDYRLQPPPLRPVEQMRKYFYTILFVKSYVYNIKGQAIIFRRKSIESLMKLINDFDETYLHSSYEHSYQNKALSQGNVDFLVRYTDNLDDVISLIDQNAFIVKLSWQPQSAPHPYPPQPIPPPPPAPYPYSPVPGYPPHNGMVPRPFGHDYAYSGNGGNNGSFIPSTVINGDGTISPPLTPQQQIQRYVEEAVDKAVGKHGEEHIKRVKVVRVHKDTRVIEVRQWDDVNKVFLTMEQPVNVGAYSAKVPDWRPGDDALLIDDKYLQRINDTPNYRRVKVTSVDLAETSGIVYVADFDDATRTITSGPYAVDLKAYCYSGKIPAWHVNDDALLFDNKYLTKLDVPEVTEGTVNIINEGINWSDPNGSSDGYYYGYDDNLTGGQTAGEPGINGPIPNSGEGQGGYTPYTDDDIGFNNGNYYNGEDTTSGNNNGSNNNGSNNSGNNTNHGSNCHCGCQNHNTNNNTNNDPTSGNTNDSQNNDSQNDDSQDCGCGYEWNTLTSCPDAQHPYIFPSAGVDNDPTSGTQGGGCGCSGNNSSNTTPVEEDGGVVGDDNNNGIEDGGVTP